MLRFINKIFLIVLKKVIAFSSRDVDSSFLLKAYMLWVLLVAHRKDQRVLSAWCRKAVHEEPSPLHLKYLLSVSIWCCQSNSFSHLYLRVYCPSTPSMVIATKLCPISLRAASGPRFGTPVIVSTGSPPTKQKSKKAPWSTNESRIPFSVPQVESVLPLDALILVLNFSTYRDRKTLTCFYKRMGKGPMF